MYRLEAHGGHTGFGQMGKSEGKVGVRRFKEIQGDSRSQELSQAHIAQNFLL